MSNEDTHMTMRFVFILVVFVCLLAAAAWFLSGFGGAGEGGVSYSPSITRAALRPELKDCDAAIYYRDTRIAEGQVQGESLEFAFEVPAGHSSDNYYLRFMKEGKVVEEVRVLSDDIDRIFQLGSVEP